MRSPAYNATNRDGGIDPPLARPADCGVYSPAAAGRALPEREYEAMSERAWLGPPARFLRLLWRDMVALMSGLASVILAVLGAIVQGTLPAWTFWAASAICLIFACYRVWLREHKDRLEAMAVSPREVALAQIREHAARGRAIRDWLTSVNEGLEREAREAFEPWRARAFELVRSNFPAAYLRFAEDKPWLEQVTAQQDRGSLSAYLDHRIAKLEEVIRHV